MYKAYRKFSIRYLNYDPDVGEPAIANDTSQKGTQQVVVEENKGESTEEIKDGSMKLNNRNINAKTKKSEAVNKYDAKGFKLPEDKWSSEVRIHLFQN
jgi:hypothetical protein